MDLNIQNIKILIANTIRAAIESLISNKDDLYVSDLFLQVDLNSGELRIYNDTEDLIVQAIIKEWAENDTEEDITIENIIPQLKEVIQLLANEKVFEQECLQKPLSITLVDKHFLEIEELLFIDDDYSRLDDPMLKDLNEDLDKFLDHLFSDVN